MTIKTKKKHFLAKTTCFKCFKYILQIKEMNVKKLKNGKS